MDEERAKRYRDKLNLVLERVGDIESWISTCSAGEFVSDKKTKLAVYKASQEMIESSMDVLAMICRDLKIVPKDDYANISALHEKGTIDSKMRQALADANGLRNRLVHRYNLLDDQVAFESIKDLLPRFKEFVGMVEGWVRGRI